MATETFTVYRSRVCRNEDPWQPWFYHASCGNGSSTGQSPCSSELLLARYMATHGGKNSGFEKAVIKNDHPSTSEARWETPDDDESNDVIMRQEEPLLENQHGQLIRLLGAAMKTAMLEERTN